MTSLIRHPVDVHVGIRIKLRRKELGLSLSGLGDRIGVSHQQILKYETGDNRVSASMLYEIARAFCIPVTYFYEGLADPVGRQPAAPAETRAPAALELVAEAGGGPEPTRSFAGDPTGRSEPALHQAWWAGPRHAGGAGLEDRHPPGDRAARPLVLELPNTGSALVIWRPQTARRLAKCIERWLNDIGPDGS